ncbi:hypothetical protein IW262DRAFT_1302327 [Armillaria fumosa]|nr:hypothetical protein IW262DRAFT_1302327 [Armillaria fumosa]
MNSTRYFIDLNSVRGGDFIPEALEAPEKLSSGIDGSGTAMTTGLAMVYTTAVVPLEGTSRRPTCIPLKSSKLATPSESETALARGMDGIIGMGVDSGTKARRSPAITGRLSEHAMRLQNGWRLVFLDSTTTVAVHTAAGPLEGMTRTGIMVPVLVGSSPASNFPFLLVPPTTKRAGNDFSAISSSFCNSRPLPVLPAIAVVPCPTTHSPCDALRRLLDANHQDALDVAPRYEKIGDFDSRTKNTRNWCSYNGPIIPTKGSSLPQPPFTAVIASSSQPLPALSFFRRSLPVADKLPGLGMVAALFMHPSTHGALVLPRLIHLRLFDNHGLRCTVQQGPEMCRRNGCRGAGKGFNQQAVGFFGGALSRRDGQYVSTLRTLDALYELSLQLPINQGGRAMLSIEIGRTFDDKRHAIFLDAHQRHCRPPSPHRIDASRFWAVVTADANSDDFGNCTSLSVTQYLDDYWPRKHWTDDDCEQSRALSSAVLGWAITVDVRLSEYLPTVPGREDGAVYRHAVKII